MLVLCMNISLIYQRHLKDSEDKFDSYFGVWNQKFGVDF